MSDLRFDADGFVDLDGYDATPLSFGERRAADRLLREGLAGGLSSGWETTVRDDSSASEHERAAIATDDVDVVVGDITSRVAERRSVVQRLRIPYAVAAAVFLVVALSLNQALRDEPAEIDIASPGVTTTTPAPPSSTEEPVGTARSTSTTTVAPTTTTSSTPATTVDSTTSTSTPTTAAPTTTAPQTSTTVSSPPTVTTGGPPNVSLAGPTTLAAGALGTYTASGSNFGVLLWSAAGPCQFEPPPGTGSTAQVRAGGQASAQPCVISVIAVADDGAEANASLSVPIG